MPNARKSSIKEQEPDIETVPVMLMKSMILKMTGKVTGKEYIFNGGGSIVDIDVRDMENLLENNKPIPSCCGSYSSPNFEVLGR